MTSEQIYSLQRYLASLEPGTRKRGQRYFETNRVAKVDPYKRGVGFRVKVRGTSNYTAKLRFADNQWSGECSCPIYIDCKHCCAAALQLLADVGEIAESKTSAEEATTPEAPATARQAPVEYSPDADVAVVFASQLGRRLSAEEKHAADAVDKLFKWHREATHAPAQLLEPIIRLRTGWSWASVEIWPIAPRTPWEAWLYLASRLRESEHRCPPALLAATDWSEVEVLMASWERQKQVEKWRTLLHTFADRPEASTMEAPQLRVRLTEKGVQLESRKPGATEFSAIKPNAFAQLTGAALQGQLRLDDPSLAIWQVFHTGFDSRPLRSYTEPDTSRILNQLLRLPGFDERTVGPKGELFSRAPERLQWHLETSGEKKIDYRFTLALPNGRTPPPSLIVLDGKPSLYVTHDAIFEGPSLGRLAPQQGVVTIPAEALETSDGLALLARLGLEPPPRIAGRVRVVQVRVIFRCTIKKNSYLKSESLTVEVLAKDDRGKVLAQYLRDGWTNFKFQSEEAEALRQYDRSTLQLVPALLEALRVTWDSNDRSWTRQAGKNFPLQFVEWLDHLPEDVALELDSLLDSLRGAPVAAQVKLEVEETGIDWFDLRVALGVADTNLTPEEIKMLLDARGGFVRLGAKGWRRLQFQLSEEEEKQLADLGLNARDFSSEPQRLHALQLAGKQAARRMLPEPQALTIERRAHEIQTRVAPLLPAGLSAELRPYQREGFHFLAYLSTNHFGGILADDMGLGKTVQALAWLLWLREHPDFTREPSLVVCPKSVTDNWVAEGARFAPGLRVQALARGASAAALEDARLHADLVVINYAQLRALEAALTSSRWHAVILDEAQYIKNPDSQTAKAAWALPARHRLALSGTPIENRLLDLWSIMGFAMPGVLGKRAAFGKSFDQRSDPFARTRLAARVRPFLLRRTKSEVAKDLPERSEEDLLCELEGEQATLYRAELKRARAALLKVQTTKELDKSRFHILTSLLRLRQICCHPALISEKAANAESAKLSALFDLLEPIIAEGHKVLVFSQFVEMLGFIRKEIEGRQWPHFLLTGDTEDRGALVRDFQQSEGAAVFLISLRAGGFGLNLTAASYVVLYDPWWNPAVENQAIDRTHRIGQTSHVIAYRLLVKESIEEKIRTLQKSKSSLAEDILGEESFTRTLTLDDFRFLLGD